MVTSRINCTTTNSRLRAFRRCIHENIDNVKGFRCHITAWICKYCEWTFYTFSGSQLSDYVHPKSQKGFRREVYFKIVITFFFLLQGEKHVTQKRFPLTYLMLQWSQAPCPCWLCFQMCRDSQTRGDGDVMNSTAAEKNITNSVIKTIMLKTFKRRHWIKCL